MRFLSYALDPLEFLLNAIRIHAKELSLALFCVSPSEKISVDGDLKNKNLFALKS